MIYRFGAFELDIEKRELRGEDGLIVIEPQVFALLALLVKYHNRVVGKDEIIEQIWDGRAVSDSALSSRIKSARQSLGDTGATQRFIRTLHGVGFRFVADVVTTPRVAIVRAEAEGAPAAPMLEAARPAIAVLRFRLVGIAGPHAAIAEALPHELIAQLSRLRWLFVIARGSSFRFQSQTDALDEIRTALKVRYCLSGTIELDGAAMSVSVELADTHTSGVLWGERFHSELGAVHEVREAIVHAVVSALELQIPLNEARLARLKSPEHLDAWSAYHLGLQHMFRFNKADNAIATAWFEQAAAKEPTFARAYAGLSFTAFQDAFLGYVPDIDGAASAARRYAELSLEHDPLDPFSNFTMGRSYWLKGDLESSLPWLDRANMLNPNFAQGRYARAFTDPMLGEGLSGQHHADAAMALSPLDPLLYGMLAGRAFSHIVRGQYADGAMWADRALRSPGAHVLISVIAAIAHGLNGDDERARLCAAMARARNPAVCADDFFRAFPFRDAAMRQAFASMLARYGF